MRLLWLSSDGDKVRLRAEQVLATARLVLVVGGLAGIYLDPSQPAANAPLVYAILTLYAIWSLLIAIGMRLLAGLPDWAEPMMFMVDFAFAAVLTLLTAGSSSPYFVFFWFFLLAAAFRYGLRGAIGAGALMILTMVAQLLVVPYVEGVPPLEIDSVVVRATYVGAMAFALGYFSQKERDLRSEAVFVARGLARARGDRSFATAIHGVALEFADTFGIERALLAVRTADGSRQCWEWLKAPHGAGEARPLSMKPDACAHYFFRHDPGIHVWQTDATWRTGIGFDFAGEKVRFAVPVPQELWAALGTHRLAGVSAPLSDGSVARIYLPDLRETSTSWLHLLHVVALQLAPALHNLLLLETRAGVIERARLARELHDRVVQSLIGLEMQLGVLIRNERRPERIVEAARAVHAQVREEIFNVRDLMHDLRPVEVTSAELPSYLADMLERFQSDTSIQAVFRCGVEAIKLSSERCGALVRVVQEALVNVRKHSGATQVTVELTGAPTGLVLTIADDGRGFRFAGRLEDDRLWAEHTGPRVIKERARAIGASLSIESRPGLGARLDLVIPDAA